MSDEAQTSSDGVVIGEDGLARPQWASSDLLMREYYDTEWGMPVRDEQGLFERLSLEAFQAGLSWATILRKRPAFRAAFADFNPDKVALFNDADVQRLMNDAGIVRNQRKILATINNAHATIKLRDKGGLADFIWSFQPDETQSRAPSRRSPPSLLNPWRCPKPCARRASTSLAPPPCMR